MEQERERDQDTHRGPGRPGGETPALGTLSECGPELLRSALDAIDDAVAIVDPGFRVLYLNHSARQLASADPDLASAPSACFLLHGGDAPCEGDHPDCPVREVLDSRHSNIVIRQYRRHDGSRRTMEAFSSPVFNAGGDLVAVVQSTRDITEKTELCDTLDLGKREWEGAVDAIPVFILLVDAAGAVRRCNRAAAERLGMGFGDVLGRPVAELLFVSPADDHLRSVEPGELEISKLGGWFRLTTHPASGGATVFVLEDITVHRRLQELAANAEMTTNLSHIFGGLRHEIGNPVNAIKLALTVLLERLGSIDEDKIRRLTERSLADVGRVERLLERLSTFNVFGDLTPKVADVGALVRDLVRLAARNLRNRGVTLTMKLPEGPVRAFVDEPATQQVLLALLSNALDALDGAREPRVLFEVGLESDDVVLRLSDNGCGIPEALLDTVFLPFFSTRAGGSGLGLSVARSLLARMNGSITLVSREGVGTVASVRLPRFGSGYDAMTSAKANCQDDSSRVGPA